MDTTTKNYPTLLKDEQKLIKLCRKGDESAQRDIYEHFAPKMFRICMRYVRSEFDTEDVLIKGFMKVFTKLDHFEYRGPGSLESWIKRVMINESLMFLRKHNNFNLVQTSEANTVETKASAESNLAAEDIYALILELPTGYRTVFNLYAIEGFSHKEIADQLGISENTSKSQLSKARALLRKKLAAQNLF